MQSNLNNLTAFNNRYYKSTTGQQSAQWIFNTLTGIAAGKHGVTVTKFTHSWVQFSVIARIAGAAPSPVTILGCHQDSINLKSPTSGRAPGADDVRFVSGSCFVPVVETSFRPIRMVPVSSTPLRSSVPWLPQVSSPQPQSRSTSIPVRKPVSLAHRPSPPATPELELRSRLSWNLI